MDPVTTDQSLLIGKLSVDIQRVKKFPITPEDQHIPSQKPKQTEITTRFPSLTGLCFKRGCKSLPFVSNGFKSAFLHDADIVAYVKAQRDIRM